MGGAPGGYDPGAMIADQDPATHPPVPGGSMVGHGGSALRLYVALLPSQAESFHIMHQLNPPPGRGGRRYWPMKTSARQAAESLAASHPEIVWQQAIIRPITVTYEGFRLLVMSGELECVDEDQWRLLGPLLLPNSRSAAGVLRYQVHDEMTIV